MRFSIFISLILSLSVMFFAHGAERITSTPSNLSADERYWISFSGDDDTDAIFLMQINANGKVTVAPKSVVRVERLGGERGASAISLRGTGKINLFVWGDDELFYRVTVNKSNLAVVNVKKVPAIEADDNDALQVTQKKSGNFLLGETPTGVLYLFPVNGRGLPAGNPIELVSTAPRDNDEATISPDGLMVLSIRSPLNDPTPPKDTLYVIQLDANGHAVSSKKIATFEDIEAADVTNPLPNGSRYAVYVVDNPEKRVMLQVLSSSGAKVGAPIALNTTDRQVDEQNVAIDPLGRFVIFTVSGENFGCPNQDVLVFQKLDGTGKATGKVKAVAKCGFVSANIENIDLLKD